MFFRCIVHLESRRGITAMYDIPVSLESLVLSPYSSVLRGHDIYIVGTCTRYFIVMMST